MINNNLNTSFIPNITTPTKTKNNSLKTAVTKIWNAVKHLFKVIGQFFKNLFCKIKPTKTPLINIRTDSTRKKPLDDNPIILDSDVDINKNFNIQNVDSPNRHYPLKNPISQRCFSQSKETLYNALILINDKIVEPKFNKAKNAAKKLVVLNMNGILKEVDKIETPNDEEKKALSNNIKFLLDQIQSSDTTKESLLSKGLKVIAETMLRFGDEKKKLFFQLLNKFSVGTAPKPNGRVKELLTWLSTDVDFEEFKKQYTPPKIENIDSSKCAAKCIEWMSHKNYSTALSTYCKNMPSVEVKNVFNDAMSALLKYKIGLFAKQCEEKLIDRFPEILKTILVKKGGGIIESIIHRLISTVENTSFPDLFKDIVTLTQKHVSSVASAKKGKVMEAFTEQKAWDPSVAQIVKKAKKTKEVEEKLYNSIAEEIVPLLFPQTEVIFEGKSREVNGIKNLIKNANLFEEFKEPAEQFYGILEKVLTPSASESLHQVKMLADEALKIIDQNAHELIIAELKKTVANATKSIFEKIINPTELKGLIASSFLPLVQEVLLKNLIEMELRKCSKLFHEKINNKVENREEIYKLAYKNVNQSIVQYKNEFAAFNPEEIKKIIYSEIKGLEKKINKYQKETNTYTEKSVKTALKQSKTKNVNNPIFGDIVEQLIFDLGEFSGVAKLFFKIIKKSDISEAITDATQEMQKSPEFLLKKITEKLKDLDCKKIENLIFNKSVKEEEDKEKKWREEVTKTAKIAHDLIHKKSRLASCLFTGGDHIQLEKVITNIYTKLFGNCDSDGKDRISQNFVLQVQDVVVEALKKGGEKADLEGVVS